MTLWTNPVPDKNTAAELQAAHAQLHAGPLPSIHPPQNIGDALQPLMREFAHAMAQRRNDAIAQKLLQSEGAAHPELLARYKDAGLTGAAAYQQYQDDVGGIDKDVKDWYARQVQQSLIDQRQDPGHTPASVDHPRHTIVLPGGQTVNDVTGDKALDYYMRTDPNLQHNRGASDPATKGWEGAMAVARGKLGPDGEFTNAYTGAEQGDQVKLVTPTGKTLTVPYSSYQAKTGPLDTRSAPNSALATPSTDTGVPTPPPTAAPPPAAVLHLQAHPELAADFDAKYGQGASAKYLGQ